MSDILDKPFHDDENTKLIYRQKRKKRIKRGLAAFFSLLVLSFILEEVGFNLGLIGIVVYYFGICCSLLYIVK